MKCLCDVLMLCTGVGGREGGGREGGSDCELMSCLLH